MNREIKVNEHITMQAPSYDWLQEKYDITVANYDFLKPWLPWVASFDGSNDGLEEMRFYQRRLIMEFDMDLNYNYDIFYDEKYVGTIGTQHMVGLNRKCEIHYLLSRDMTGKGIMTSCVNALVDELAKKTNLHRIAISPAEDNTASCAVAERCGFTKEAILKDALFLNGKFHNTVVYAKILDSRD